MLCVVVNADMFLAPNDLNKENTNCGQVRTAQGALAEIDERGP